MPLLRTYEPFECGPDGYPLVWHRGIVHQPDHADPSYHGPRLWVEEFDLDHIALSDTVGIKDVVRHRALHRCERCKHPFVVGESGVWEDVTGVEDKALLAETGRLFYEGMALSESGQRRGIHWSRCDEFCEHKGPARIVPADPQEYGDPERMGPVWDEIPPAFIACGKDSTGGVLTGFVPGTMAVEAAFRILTVHHLNGHKHDLRWWNLVALCQRCHLYIQRKVQMERVYPYEHSEWFKPYAAGWYAYSYHGEDLSREQTMERLDGLLALERMA